MSCSGNQHNTNPVVEKGIELLDALYLTISILTNMEICLLIHSLNYQGNNYRYVVYEEFHVKSTDLCLIFEM